MRLPHRLSILLLLLFAASPAYAATTLLPNGKQCFTTATGAVVSGSLNMYFPATTTPKPTWQDSNQNTLNSQPIQLDANGCAIIYGVGQYRQQLYSGPVSGGVTTGTLLWDQLTTDTSAFNAVFWAGTAAGTPNVITVVDTGFNGTDGSVINFVALSTNTGATTLNPSGFGPISVVKDTASGPSSLIGGEIVATNIISVVYSSSGNNFHLLNTAIPSASGNTAPLCGATNLKITNSGGTPNTIITVTADTALMSSAAGAVINRGTVSQNINISTGTVTPTAGGMDGEVTGSSAWLYLWLIDNGAAPAGLASAAAGNGLTPNMPSGYTYKCRIGAMRVDGGGNLMRTLQKGIRAQYTLVSPSNTQAYPTIGSTASATLASMAVSGVVPAVASTIFVVGSSSGVNANMVISPNSVSSATVPAGGTTMSLCGNIGTAGANGQISNCSFLLESTNIFAATNAGTLTVVGTGWLDQVNAN